MRLAKAARLLAQFESVNRESLNDGDDRLDVGALPLQSSARKPAPSLLPDSPPGEHSVPLVDPVRQPKETLQSLLVKQNSSWGGVLRNDRKKKHFPHGFKESLTTTTSSSAAKLCDPNLDEADVGLLSCGFNYYCAESHDSYLGGICVEDEDHSTTLQQQQKEHRRRRAEQEMDDLGDLGDNCDPSNPYFSQCDCTMFDTVLGNGYIKCTLYDNYCFPECPTICDEITFGGNLTSNVVTEGITYCHTFKGSYEKEFCYTILYGGGCRVSLEGTTCNSCKDAALTCNVTTDANVGLGFDHSWDCTNVPDGTQGSYCNAGEYFIPVLASPACNASTPTYSPAPLPSGNGTSTSAPAGMDMAAPISSPVTADPPVAGNATAALPTTIGSMPTFSPAPSGSVAPSGRTLSSGSVAPSGEGSSSSAPVVGMELDAPTTFPTHAEPSVAEDNAPAAPPTTTTSDSAYNYGTGRSAVLVVICTSLAAAMAIALGSAVY